jgi:predicted ATPase
MGRRRGTGDLEDPIVITSLALKNFKAWQHTGDVSFGPITAFFGSNSSGKTSFLQSLLLLKQTTDSADRRRVFDFGGGASLVNLGTFRDVLFDHDPNNVVGISVAWRDANAVKIPDPSDPSKPAVLHANSLSLSIEVDAIDDSPIVQRVTYSVGDRAFSLERRKSNREQYDLRGRGYRFKRVPGRAWTLPPPGKFYSFPDQVRSYYQNATFLSDLELRFELMCGRIAYLGPLRQDPERQYIRSGTRPIDVGRRGESAIEALIASSGDGNVNSRGFVIRRDGRRRMPRISVQQHVAEWLKELGLIDSFRVEPVDDRKTLYRVMVQRTPASTPVLLTDVGFGVSQVLPVLVQLAYVPEGSTVLLEQPEIHLHPAVQSGLADMIIEAAKARNLQVIIESHSEHLLMRLQRRIAEKELVRGITLLPDDCRLYFCTSDQSGRSTLSQLTMDLFGNITNWPDEFFGDTFSEAAAMTIAAQRRASTERTA